MNKLGEDKKEVDACENCKTKLCESGATMNNITGLIEVLDRIRQEYKVVDIGGQFGMLNGTKLEALTQTICILKSLDSGGKLVPEVEEIGDIILTEKPHLYLNTKDIEVIAQAIRSKLLINRAAFMEKLPGIIGKFILEKQSARQAGMNTKYAKDLVKKIASEL